ncbi:hypothetical protein GIB67_007396 [Kingdonia uniflora]|uniref:Uncharacterized protein n=1 Tax=Kingdonia uniflora TaxID=39325 RepID=A0A7J7MLG7_9MAGN|nr:hypothetical protein GIB67_007396 [Kingdonia uniflora]
MTRYTPSSISNKFRDFDIVAESSVHRSFAIADNLGEISAKAQIQTVCFDNLGLVLAALLNILCRNSQRLQAALPFLVYPFFSAIDLFGIYQGLKYVHLQTLTKNRLEIVLDTWIQSERIPSPAQVSKEEGIDFPWGKGRKLWSIRIGCVDLKDLTPKFSMMTMRSLRGDDSYFICMETYHRSFIDNPQRGLLLCLREGANTEDIIMGLHQACNIRKELLRSSRWQHIVDANSNISESDFKEWIQVLDDSKRCLHADGDIYQLKEKIKGAGWAVKNVLLSVQEQARYSILDD